MNKYIGKICPYCKATIEKDDEIVVCSICDMPHHKECWIDNQGCTTFGCTGTISTPEDDKIGSSEEDFEIVFYDDDSLSMEQYQYCPKCGAQNLVGSVFCCKCGIAIREESPVSVSAPEHMQYCQNFEANVSPFQHEESDLALLIRANVSYYTAKFNDIKRQRNKASWNWSAFLIAPYWLIYRKMYAYGAAALSGLFLLSLLGGWLMYLLQMAVYVVFGILGNYIYMDSLNKKVAQINLLSGQYKNDYITKNSGTNLTAAILSAVGYAIIVAIVQLV